MMLIPGNIPILVDTGVILLLVLVSVGTVFIYV